MISLPIYYSSKVKGRQKLILVGMNIFMRMHYHPRNALIKHYYTLIKHQIRGVRSIKGKIAVHYSLFYKNKICDAPNVIAVIDKILLDALQEFGVIEQDDCQHYVKSSWEVVEQDRKNPRVEVTLFEVK